jgi:hypothetical protein
VRREALEIEVSPEMRRLLRQALELRDACREAGIACIVTLGEPMDAPTDEVSGARVTCGRLRDLHRLAYHALEDIRGEIRAAMSEHEKEGDQ